MNVNRCECCGKPKKRVSVEGICYNCATYRNSYKNTGFTDFWLSLLIMIAYVFVLTIAIIGIPYLVCDRTFKDFYLTFLETFPVVCLILGIIFGVVDTVLLIKHIINIRNRNLIFRKDWSSVSLQDVNNEEVEEQKEKYVQEVDKIEIQDFEMYLADTTITEVLREDKIEVKQTEPKKTVTKKVQPRAKKVKMPKNEVAREKKRYTKYNKKKVRPELVALLCTLSVVFVGVAATLAISLGDIDVVEKNMITEATTEAPFRDYGYEDYGILTLDNELPVVQTYNESGAIVLTWGNTEVVLDYAELQPNQAFSEYVQFSMEYKKELDGIDNMEMKKLEKEGKDGYIVEYSKLNNYTREYSMIYKGYLIKTVSITFKNVEDTTNLESKFDEIIDAYTFVE